MINNIEDQLKSIGWQLVIENMNNKGFAVCKNIINAKQCQDLIDCYSNPLIYRKVVVMARHKFGLGEYKYYSYPLPQILQTIREHLYYNLSNIANNWMQMLNIETRFSESFEDFQHLCRINSQNKPTPLILKYGKGGYNTLHQDIYGAIFFPIQVAIFLNEPEKDYTGGEFILTEATSRAQSKAMVLKPNKGDMLIFTTNFRPAKSIKGYYRVNMKHGISEVTSGERHVVGIIFHDAIS